MQYRGYQNYDTFLKPSYPKKMYFKSILSPVTYKMHTHILLNTINVHMYLIWSI